MCWMPFNPTNARAACLTIPGSATEIRCAVSGSKILLSSRDRFSSGTNRKVSRPAFRPYSVKAVPVLPPDSKTTLS